MYKIDGTTRFSITIGGHPAFNKFGKVIYLVELSVDLDGEGYNCWGYKISDANAVEPGPLHFNHTWLSAGQVLDEVLKEKSLD